MCQERTSDWVTALETCSGLLGHLGMIKISKNGHEKLVAFTCEGAGAGVRHSVPRQPGPTLHTWTWQLFPPSRWVQFFSFMLSTSSKYTRGGRAFFFFFFSHKLCDLQSCRKKKKKDFGKSSLKSSALRGAHRRKSWMSL